MERTPETNEGLNVDTTIELEATADDGPGRSQRAFTLRELEAFCAKVRKAEGDNRTVVRVIRNNMGEIRLVAEIPE